MQQFLNLPTISQMINKSIPSYDYDYYAKIFNKYGHISHLLYFELIGHKIWTFGAADAQQSFTKERNEQIQSISTDISKLANKTIVNVMSTIVNKNNMATNYVNQYINNYLKNKLSEPTRNAGKVSNIFEDIKKTKNISTIQKILEKII